MLAGRQGALLGQAVLLVQTGHLPVCVQMGDRYAAAVKRPTPHERVGVALTQNSLPHTSFSSRVYVCACIHVPGCDATAGDGNSQGSHVPAQQAIRQLGPLFLWNPDQGLQVPSSFLSLSAPTQIMVSAALLAAPSQRMVRAQHRAVLQHTQIWEQPPVARSRIDNF